MNIKLPFFFISLQEINHTLANMRYILYVFIVWLNIEERMELAFRFFLKFVTSL